MPRTYYCNKLFISQPYGSYATTTLAKDPHQHQHQHLHHHHRPSSFSAHIPYFHSVLSTQRFSLAQSQHPFTRCPCCPHAHLLFLAPNSLPHPLHNEPRSLPPTILIARHGLQSGHCYLPYPLPPRATDSSPYGIHQFILHRFLHQLFRHAFSGVSLDVFLC